MNSNIEDWCEDLLEIFSGVPLDNPPLATPPSNYHYEKPCSSSIPPNNNNFNSSSVKSMYSDYFLRHNTCANQNTLPVTSPSPSLSPKNNDTVECNHPTCSFQDFYCRMLNHNLVDHVTPENDGQYRCHYPGCAYKSKGCLKNATRNINDHLMRNHIKNKVTILHSAD